MISVDKGGEGKAWPCCQQDTPHFWVVTKAFSPRTRETANLTCRLWPPKRGEDTVLVASGFLAWEHLEQSEQTSER
jgi:hypothetical protein